MAKEKIVIQWHRNSGSWYRHAVAGAEVWVDEPLESLEPWRMEVPSPPWVPPEDLKLGAAPFSGVVTHQGPGWVGGFERQVSAWWADSICGIFLSGLGELRLNSGAFPRLAWRQRRAEACRQHLEEALLGPGLVLALATLGTFSLHASAVRTEAGTAAFLGMSGSGKSTLAQAAGAPWRPAADDLLPLTKSDSGIVALPQFPQLKWPRKDQFTAADALSLGAVFVLDSVPASRETCRPLNGALALASLLRHTVAGKLFSSPLLERQLDLLSATAEEVPVYLLQYPRDRSRLPRLRQTVLEVLSRGT